MLGAWSKSVNVGKEKEHGFTNRKTTLAETELERDALQPKL